MPQRWEPRLVVACVIVLLAMHTRPYAQTWRSELSLWRGAVQVSPLKPRAWINYGAALTLRGQVSDAWAVWQHADKIADQPHVLVWDRKAAHALAQENMAALDRIFLPLDPRDFP